MNGRAGIPGAAAVATGYNPNMVAIDLFDSLARSGSSSHLSRLSEQMIQASLNELESIKNYERMFGRPDDESTWLDVARSIWKLYAKWVQDAEQVLIRSESAHVEPPAAATHVRALERALGAIRLRLELTPERIVHVRRRVNAGDVVPAEVIRHELQARLRG
jgi:hypothetical protein